MIHFSLFSPSRFLFRFNFRRFDSSTNREKADGKNVVVSFECVIWFRRISNTFLLDLNMEIMNFGEFNKFIHFMLFYYSHHSQLQTRWGWRSDSLFVSHSKRIYLSFASLGLKNTSHFLCLRSINTLVIQCRYISSFSTRCLMHVFCAVLMALASRIFSGLFAFIGLFVIHLAH